MISIIGYMFEEEEKNTKLHWAEKAAGGLGVAGGLGLYGAGRYLEDPKSLDPVNAAVKGAGTLSDEGMGRLYRAYDEAIGTPKGMRAAGLIAAGTTGAILGSHKLYKMYKNKKNKEK